MKNKKVLVVALIVGILLMLLAVVLAFVGASSADIIGGVGWPTFAYHFGKTAWLAWIGACLAIGTIVILTLRKK